MDMRLCYGEKQSSQGLRERGSCPVTLGSREGLTGEGGRSCKDWSAFLPISLKGSWFPQGQPLLCSRSLSFSRLLIRSHAPCV